MMNQSSTAANTNNMQAGNAGSLDFSILPKILKSITLFQWQSSILGKRTFARSKIVDAITLDNSLADGLKLMHDNGNSYGMCAIANKELT